MYQDDLKMLCSVRAETLSLATGLYQEQADFTPASGKWSVAEVLDHLVLAEELYRKKFSDLIALQKAGKKAEIRSDSSEINTSILFIPQELLPLLELPLTIFNLFVPSFLREKVTQYRVMPAQTPSLAKPRPSRKLGTLQAELRASLDATRQLFDNNADLDYRRMVFSHPLMGKNDILKMIRILALHERRHQTQIREILHSRAFPAARKPQLATSRI